VASRDALFVDEQGTFGQPSDVDRPIGQLDSLLLGAASGLEEWHDSDPIGQDRFHAGKRMNPSA
jgi:hypothetical protein